MRRRVLTILLIILTFLAWIFVFCLFFSLPRKPVVQPVRVITVEVTAIPTETPLLITTTPIVITATPEPTAIVIPKVTVEVVTATPEPTPRVVTAIPSSRTPAPETDP